MSEFIYEMNPSLLVYAFTCFGIKPTFKIGKTDVWEIRSRAGGSAKNYLINHSSLMRGEFVESLEDVFHIIEDDKRKPFSWESILIRLKIGMEVPNLKSRNFRLAIKWPISAPNSKNPLFELDWIKDENDDPIEFRSLSKANSYAENFRAITHGTFSVQVVGFPVSKELDRWLNEQDMKEKKRNYSEILLHNIEWWYEDFFPGLLPESEELHIQEMIYGGYREGELCYVDPGSQKEKRGWWRIVKD